MQRIPQAKRSSGGLRVVRLLLLLGLVAAALGAASIAAVFWVYGRDKALPDIQKLSDYKPKQVTAILDAKGQRIGELFEERRTFVPYKEIPQFVVDSFVAAEDQKFWTHTGIDYVGMVRAFFTNLRAGRAKQGASTITQQVVKTFLLTPEKTFRRKIQEVILARRLETSLSKQEIMTLYLNQIYFGHGRYGVQEAARFYFGKEIDQLNIGEAALLGGLPQSPENISPHKNPQRAKDRQTYVLNNLALTGKITREEAKKWIDAPIQIAKKPFSVLHAAPEWVDLVRRDLVARNGEDAMATLGAEVQTTVDPKIQALAQKALQHGLRAVDKRQKIGVKVRAVGASGVDGEVAKLKKQLPKGGPAAKQVYEAVVTGVFDDDAEIAVDLGGYKGAIALSGDEDERFNPPGSKAAAAEAEKKAAKKGDKADKSDKAAAVDDSARRKPSERFAVGDVIKVVVSGKAAKASDDDDARDDAKKPGALKHGKNRLALAPGPEGAVVVIDIKTRKVRALIGGFSSKVAGFNRATMARRQPGSSFKPFVFAAALDANKTTGGRVLNDAPAFWANVDSVWRPKNYDAKSAGGTMLMRKALAKSINTIAIQLCSDARPDAVAELARKMGIASPLPHELSIALGSGEVTPLEATNAMATFAAGGMTQAPRFIEAVNGKPEPAAEATLALRPEVAYITLDMMRSVVQEGTATAAKALGPYVAGKTGTSNDSRDTWFVGLTADYAIGVWLGYDDPKEMRGETGGHAAVPVFVEIARAMGLGNKPFGPRPDNVVEASIDRETGLLAAEGAPKGSFYTELFVAGTAPVETAPLPDETTPDNFFEQGFESGEGAGGGAAPSERGD
jgi:penicillin-binding protein 1A